MLEPSESLQPGQMVGQYRLKGRLGKGAASTVYAAIHPIIGKEVAIKILDTIDTSYPEAVERFIQEAQTVNQIRHPNIIDIFAFGTLPDGRPYFAMDHLKGVTLAERLDQGAIGLELTIPILLAVVEALDACHQVKVVHRDLKPLNIFLVNRAKKQPEVKVLDFGIAKLLDARLVNIEKINHTSGGFAIGTPSYMSPEQAQSEKIDERADIYALGIIAFEMLVGYRPFTAETAHELLKQHVHADIPNLQELRPDLPIVLCKIITRMLDKKPDKRPSLEEIRSILTVLKNELNPDPLMSGRFATRARALKNASQNTRTTKARRHRNHTIIAIVLLLLATGIFGTTIHRGSSVLRYLIPIFAPPLPKAINTTSLPNKIVPNTDSHGLESNELSRGTLIIKVNAPKAIIQVDGKTVGRSVNVIRIKVESEIPHSVQVTAPGYQSFHEKIRLEQAQNVEIQAQLKKLPRGAFNTKSKARNKINQSDKLDYTIDPFQ